MNRRLCFFAIQNKKKRFFIPSKECSFGGISIPLMMIDTGCNTSLLPTPDVDELVEKFNRKEYAWTIKLANTVGDTSVNLVITKIVGKIKSCIKSDHFNYCFETDSIRFHLNKETIDVLINRALITANEIKKLSNFGLNHLKTRKHGLIGQNILSDKFCFQYKGVFCVLEIDSYNDLNDLGAEILKLKMNEDAYITEHFDYEEFHDLEDEDHDEEDWGDEIIVDFYDE